MVGSGIYFTMEAKEIRVAKSHDTGLSKQLLLSRERLCNYSISKK